MLKKALPLFALLTAALSLPAQAWPGMGKGEPKPIQAWWPETLNLQPLRQNATLSDPWILMPSRGSSRR